MKENSHTYKMPNLGCMVGTAYQTLLSKLSQALTDKGLDVTTGEYIVLRALYDSDGMQQCEIATLIGKDKSAVCRTITAMVNKNLVTTESMSHKCLKVYLTPLAREIEPIVMAVAIERHKALTELLTPDELRVFSTILDKLIKDT